MSAIGLVETTGLTPAVAAMDSMAKAAQVSVLGYRKAGGGRVAVVISGDIAAVRAAIEAGASHASSVGTVLAARVIANPPDNLLRSVLDGGT